MHVEIASIEDIQTALTRGAGAWSKLKPISVAKDMKFIEVYQFSDA